MEEDQENIDLNAEWTTRWAEASKWLMDSGQIKAGDLALMPDQIAAKIQQRGQSSSNPDKWDT